MRILYRLWDSVIRFASHRRVEKVLTHVLIFMVSAMILRAQPGGDVLAGVVDTIWWLLLIVVLSNLLFVVASRRLWPDSKVVHRD
jgi:hypothetical protein